MKIKTWLVAGSLLMALGLPSLTLAADSVAFKKTDRNGDFMITSDELRELPELHAQFQKLDRDKNGYLDRAEFNRGLAQALSTRAREAG